MVAAVEIVDSRFADWRIKLADTVSDLASNGAVAISSRVVPLDGVDPRLIGMTLTRKGALVDTGAGAAALGDPVRVVAWLANTLGEMGAKLEAGHLVMTGALHAAVPMAPGRSSGPSSTGSARSPSASSSNGSRGRLDMVRRPKSRPGWPRRGPTAPRSARCPPSSDGFDLAAAYAVQRRLRNEAGPQVGWKLGVTSRAKQVQVGVSEPIRGFLAAGDALDIGEPLVVGSTSSPGASRRSCSSWARPGRAVGHRGGGAGRHRGGRGGHRGARLALHGLQVHDAGRGRGQHLAGRFLVGPAVPATGIDLRLVGVVLEHNGEVVATASGAAALGHPAAAVAWLVRSLAAEDEGLKAGDIVLSGGLTAAVPVSRATS